MAKKNYIALGDLVLWDLTKNVRQLNRSPEVIQSYADSIDELPPIVVDQHNRILDGFHRYYGHKLAERDRIAFRVHRVESDAEAVEYAIKSNSDHGVALSLDEIKIAANTLSELGYTNKEIAKIVKKSEHSVGRYVKETRERREHELIMQVGEMYAIADDDGKKVYTYQSLGEELCIPSSKIGRLVNEYNKHKNSPVPVDRSVEKQLEDRVELSTEPESPDSPEPVGDVDESDEEKDEASKRIHTEMQYKLLRLGNLFGLSVWVATDNHRKSFEGVVLSELPGMLAFLPSKIRAKTPQSIERIDVLWLQDDNIIAAFEVEHSTNIDSGLLRMSDMLVALKGTTILTNIVAPNDRIDEAKRKMNRPTFKQTGQTDSCRFIPYSDLNDKFTEAEQNGSLSYNWQELLNQIGFKL